MGTYDFLGIYIPDLLVKAVLAVAVSFLLVKGLARLGAYKAVWHPALFNVSLFIIVLGLLALPGSLWWFLK